MTSEEGPSGRGEVTRLLGALRGGDREALDQIWDLLYQELTILARSQLASPRATLDTTALVHEAYLKLVRVDGIDLRDRSHFFALAAKVMREIIVDFARRTRARKRGGEVLRLTLDESLAEPAISIEREASLVLAIDQALDRLGQLSERLNRVFELRYFGGLSEQETADVLGVSLRTVQRDWVKSRAWLQRELA
jgi:RNA polymerase sigma factor (TIGR02999 family)